MSEQFVDHGANTTQPENCRKAYDVVEKEIKRLTHTAEPARSTRKIDKKLELLARGDDVKEKKQKHVKKKLEKLNNLLISYCPELDSKYGRYPITFKHWCHVDEEINGNNCFIESTQNEGVKEDYVYSEDSEPGYYHLLTKQAYIQLYKDLETKEPSLPCCWDKAGAKKYDEYARVQKILYNRSIASKPDDKVAIADGKKVTKLKKDLRDKKISDNNKTAAVGVAIAFGAGAAVYL